MEHDKSLEVVNKKSWTKTRPIMFCNVLVFWSLIGITINRALEWNFSWFILFTISATMFTVLSVFYAAELERQL